ncbi:hypothetical protein AVW11_09610 [Streptomyces amritsarensis]|uniref:Lipoprotein n=2 Tax=Streptomyces amritsarensis TaxID=681158 RepID=A0ABX3G9G9_9ACTN|nr:hypothetical protein AVW11_09610 [Streptomyces amritsarensis]
MIARLRVMKVRKVRKVLVLGLLGLTVLAGCGVAGVWAASGGFYGCTFRDEALAEELAAFAILDVRPPDAPKSGKRYSNCDEDDGFAAAGQYYEHTGPREELLAFYRATAAKDGWQPGRDRRDGLCFSKPYGTVTAHLSVWFPSSYGMEGEPRANAEEYGLEVTASHDGSAWC